MKKSNQSPDLSLTTKRRFGNRQYHKFHRFFKTPILKNFLYFRNLLSYM